METGQAFETGLAFVVLGDVQQTEGVQQPVGADESQQHLSDVAAHEELDLKGKSDLDFCFTQQQRYARRA